MESPAKAAATVYVPALGVLKVQVYVVVLPKILGPELLAHEVCPAVPPIDQLTAPVGAVAFVEPTRVAVQRMDPPRVVEPDCESE